MLPHTATGMPLVDAHEDFTRARRHRVSVALALGHGDIEAWVTQSGSLRAAVRRACRGLI